MLVGHLPGPWLLCKSELASVERLYSDESTSIQKNIKQPPSLQVPPQTDTGESLPPKSLLLPPPASLHPPILAHRLLSNSSTDEMDTRKTLKNTLKTSKLSKSPYNILSPACSECPPATKLTVIRTGWCIQFLEGPGMSIIWEPWGCPLDTVYWTVSTLGLSRRCLEGEGNNNWATVCLPYHNWVVENNKIVTDLGSMIDFSFENNFPFS